MNTLPIAMTNPADSHKNHSACAGKRGLGAMPSNKQSAKGATFALLATMLRGWFLETMEPCIRKKKFHFVKTFGPLDKTIGEIKLIYLYVNDKIFYLIRLFLEVNKNTI